MRLLRARRRPHARPDPFERLIEAARRSGHPIALHECRHTFASLMIAAGVNAKAICDAMGHASVTMTFDRYGHLMPDGRDQARERLDAYLTSASSASRSSRTR